jgi:hypothetical protein
MANKLILKRSSVALKVPLAADLEPGELAVNLTDQKLYSKKTDGTVILVGTGIGGAGSGDVVGPASATDNAIARFDGTNGKVIQNSGASIDDSGNLTALSNNATGTGANIMPTGTTAQRPASPTVGMVRFNTTLDSLENYTSQGWFKVNVTIPVLTSVDGTIYEGFASTLSLSGTGFGVAEGTVRFTSGGTTADVAVTPSSQTSATVTVPSAIFNLSAGSTVSVRFTNNDGGASNTVNKSVQGTPTGGTITTVGGFRYHQFNTSANFVVPSGFSASAEYLIVAGGSAGGKGFGGGGGAGGYRAASTTITAQTYSIVVGGGGAPTSTTGGNGGNSSGFGITSTGGGGGGGNGTNITAAISGNSGGSGGGGSGKSGGGAGGSGGSGTSGQGFAGGAGISASAIDGGGGGGGAGAVGQTAVNAVPTGAGGVGLQWLNGTFYGGGGGGNGNGAGGNGGGGTGNTGGNGGSGAANSGGGGAGAYNAHTPGSGGSGVVIVRYPQPT